MARPPTLTVSPDEREQLLLLAEGNDARLRLRAAIILTGTATVVTTAGQLGCAVSSVIRWRKRWREAGLDGLGDAPRCGGPRGPRGPQDRGTYRRALRRRGSGSTRTVAAEMGVSRQTISRWWRSTSSSMRVGAPQIRGTAFHYYGAKRQLAGRYPAPRYRTIVEPFAGSGSYAVHHLLAGDADRAVLIEKDPRVVELWRRLLAMTDAELAALEPPAAGERTEDFLFMTVAAGNAIARCKSCTFSKRAAGVWPGMHRSMLVAIPQLRGKVEVIEGDHREASVDGPATWFVDPPYQPQDSAEGNKTVYPRGMGYAPDCSADSLDYAALAGWCKTRPGQVIVCEQAGAAWLDFEPLTAAQDSQGKMKREVIWVQEL